MQDIPYCKHKAAKMIFQQGANFDAQSLYIVSRLSTWNQLLWIPRLLEDDAYVKVWLTGQKMHSAGLCIITQAWYHYSQIYFLKRHTTTIKLHHLQNKEQRIIKYGIRDTKFSNSLPRLLLIIWACSSWWTCITRYSLLCTRTMQCNISCTARFCRHIWIAALLKQRSFTHGSSFTST